MDPSVVGASNVGKVFEYIGDSDPDLDKSPEIVSFADVKYVSEDGENIDLTDRTRARDQWNDVDVVLGSTVRFKDDSDPNNITYTTYNLIDIIRNNDQTQWQLPTVKVATTDTDGDNNDGDIDLAADAVAIGVEIDGYQVSEDDLVLIKDQADATQNGIWVVTVDGWRRYNGESGFDQFQNNKVVRVEAGVGETNSNTYWTYDGDNLTDPLQLWNNVLSGGQRDVSVVEITFSTFIPEGNVDAYAYVGPAVFELLDDNDVEITASMRVLITGLTDTWDEVAGAESGRDNGIYIVSPNGPWTRAADAEEADDYRKYQYAKVGTDRFFQFSSDTPTDMAGAKVFQELLFEVGGAGIVGDTAVDFTGETLNGLGEADLDEGSRILLKIKLLLVKMVSM